MNNLKQILTTKIPIWREQLQKIQKEYSDYPVSTITVKQLFKGLRDVIAVVCDTSYVDPQKGLFIRDIPVLKLMDLSAEELFFLLCSGEQPDAQSVQDLQMDLSARREVPQQVWDLLESQPPDTHPMSLLSMSMLAMQRESVFTKAYQKGLSREQYWEATFEDALNIIARLPVIAAYIYRRFLRDEQPIAPLAHLNHTDNFANMLGFPSREFKEFLQKFFVVHSDHEGANASVFSSRVVNSSLSDLYYSISASMNSLAGPLHGLANQESLKFILSVIQEFAGVPSEEQLEKLLKVKIQNGEILPGFGHAVLRAEDPRYQALFEFGEQLCPDDPVFQVAGLLKKLVPPLLIEKGKASNPYPNIDGITGPLLYHFGMKELTFYTVMFSTAQVLGICAQLIINQALMLPIFRPRSIPLAHLKELIENQ